MDENEDEDDEARGTDKHCGKGRKKNSKESFTEILKDSNIPHPHSLHIQTSITSQSYRPCIRLPLAPDGLTMASQFTDIGRI